MGGGSRVVVDEFLAASAPEEAFTDAASLVVVFVSIPLFPSVELSPISGFISDRLTKRFVVFAYWLLIVIGRARRKTPRSISQNVPSCDM
jgi:hypothetical protein